MVLILSKSDFGFSTIVPSSNDLSLILADAFGIRIDLRDGHPQNV